jgi:uncharacterized surface protein with fasciclin (FAS1) repeats
MSDDRSNIIDTIDKRGRFSAFARMLKSSKVADLITGPGPFTVFAPTNDAFGKVPDAQMNSWLSQTDQIELAKVLAYHIVPSKLFATKLGSNAPVATLAGAEVTFSDDDNHLMVNGSGVQARNIEAANGIVHALDTVLTPPADARAATAAAVSAGPTIATITPIEATVTPTTTQADGHSDAPTPAPVAVPAPAAPTPALL